MFGCRGIFICLKVCVRRCNLYSTQGSKKRSTLSNQDGSVSGKAFDSSTRCACSFHCVTVMFRYIADGPRADRASGAARRRWGLSLSFFLEARSYVTGYADGY